MKIVYGLLVLSIFVLNGMSDYQNLMNGTLH